MAVKNHKIPFNINVVMDRIREAVKPFPKAAMFELAERGYRSPFEQLVACVISIRAYDEVSLPASIRLFERARSPAEIAALPEVEIDRLIQPATFHERKAGQIRAIAREVQEKYGGELPCDFDIMTSFAGVGLKCANLALGIGCGEPRVSADVHVDRVTNRWGYVHTSSPEQTSRALEQKLPEEYWIEINRLLVPFGKHICTGSQPCCSTCPVLEMCQQVGVEKHR
jgi:endonuclease III